MHSTQQQLLKLADQRKLDGLPLLKISALLGGKDNAQTIKHHLFQLAKKNLIRIDKAKKVIERIKSGEKGKSYLIPIPILGSANCGEALQFALERPEGHLQVSPAVLGNSLKKAKELFALRAIGTSMNRAQKVQGGVIDDGDYVIVDGALFQPQNGEYVVSIIDGCANIKRFHHDERNRQILLVSESSEHIPPICIHQDDLVDYRVNGKVLLVIKVPDDLDVARNASMQDILQDLGPQSKEDYDYYENV
ncbi:MAG: S24 family peptidase [Candidatus Peregrinibacteria bacterium]|nr:S24 family peptidase [Candidatus Peregrinibacteria bacterium]